MWQGAKEHAEASAVRFQFKQRAIASFLPECTTHSLPSARYRQLAPSLNALRGAYLE